MHVGAHVGSPKNGGGEGSGQNDCRCVRRRHQATIAGVFSRYTGMEFSRNESGFKMDPERLKEEQEVVVPEGTILLREAKRSCGIGPGTLPQQAAECVRRLIMSLYISFKESKLLLLAVPATKCISSHLPS